MADPVPPAGSDVSAGTYRCTVAVVRLSVASTKSLPSCPDCKRLVAHGDRSGTAPVTPQARSKSGLITKRRVGWL
jgi:hypothetical protein